MKSFLKSGLIKGLTVMFLSLTLTFGACNVINQITGNEDDDNSLILLAAAAVLSQASTCSNTSGLVICIPPGLRF